MAKPVIKFKTYRQAAAVGGKIYGVPNLGDPVVASVTMQEVIDYAKLHSYSAATLEALLSQVISGVADLVARDGKPRNLSDLLKFEPVIKGTFANMEQTVTDQKILVRPRLLKEIRVQLDAGDYAWQNQNDKESPRLISVAPSNGAYATVDLASFTAAVGNTPFGWTYAGNRLGPNGYEESMKVAVLLKRPGDDKTYHYEKSEVAAGLFRINDSLVTDNSVDLLPDTDEGYPHVWSGNPETPTTEEITPASGDVVTFQFTRTTASGDTYTAEKSYTL